MAHRAAHPDRYPVRKALLETNPERTRKHAQYPPTQVRDPLPSLCAPSPTHSFAGPPASVRWRLS